MDVQERDVRQHDVGTSQDWRRFLRMPERRFVLALLASLAITLIVVGPFLLSR